MQSKWTKSAGGTERGLTECGLSSIRIPHVETALCVNSSSTNYHRLGVVARAGERGSRARNASEQLQAWLESDITSNSYSFTVVSFSVSSKLHNAQQMPFTLAAIVQQVLEDVQHARRYSAPSTQAAQLVPLLEQTALQQWYLQPLSNNISLLMTRFAALSPNLLVPVEGQQVRSEELAAVTAAAELRPIKLLMLTVQSSKFNGCATPEECQLDAETRTKEVKDLAGKQGGYRLTCLRAAILAAKVACCVDFSNNEDSPEAMAWQCLLLISARLDHVAPDQCSLDAETQQEEQMLCLLLTQLLFSALQESANKRKHKQYRGRAACSMLVSMFYCGAADCATIAGLLLKFGKLLSAEFSSCCKCQC